jgi:hypothetical protein
MMKKEVMHPGLLLLLERPYPEVAEDATNAIAFLDIPGVIPDKTRLREVVITAFESGMDYWASLAIEWLDAGQPVDEAIAGTLNSVASAKWASQHTRQAAFRIARKWEKKTR